MNGRWWIAKRRTRTLEKRKVTVKVMVEGALEELTEKFEDTLSEKFGKHVFNIRHQYLQSRKLREQLKPNQMFLHIDFSENYTCKYNTEIQSVHFGAPNMQTTLHTGMLCTATEVVPFATLSESMCHDLSAT